jgi:hypothetical protein
MTVEQAKRSCRRMEERRKADPSFDKLNAFGCQCAREISGFVSIAEFGNAAAAKDAAKVLSKFR